MARSRRCPPPPSKDTHCEVNEWATPPSPHSHAQTELCVAEIGSITSIVAPSDAVGTVAFTHTCHASSSEEAAQACTHTHRTHCNRK